MRVHSKRMYVYYCCIYHPVVHTLYILECYGVPEKTNTSSTAVTFHARFPVHTGPTHIRKRATTDPLLPELPSSLVESPPQGSTCSGGFPPEATPAGPAAAARAAVATMPTRASIARALRLRLSPPQVMMFAALFLLHSIWENRGIM